MTIGHILLVGIGGFFGAIARYAMSQSLNKPNLTSIPLGTLLINLVGAFLLGGIIGASPNLWIILLFGTGFMGAFTTFSTLKLEMTQMLVHKQKRSFIIYTVTTYGIGLLLAYLGFLVGDGLFK